MIQAMFGGKIVDISASYLIKKGHLLPPYIFIEPIDSDHGYRSWKKIYKDSIVENIKFHNHVADTANHLVSRGLSTLVLVQQYPHGDYLKGVINGAQFITGRDKTEVRTKALQDLREKRLKCLIATSLADEGLDVPCLDAALLAGGGASATRINQRIGRTIRKDKSIDKGRDKSIVVVYDHFKTKHLQDHTKKIRRILKREEEFVVKESNGPDFICDEIDKTLGIETHRESIFDV
jgi:superfamily II DNA or RNA helicase